MAAATQDDPSRNARVSYPQILALPGDRDTLARRKVTRPWRYYSSQRHRTVRNPHTTNPANSLNYYFLLSWAAASLLSGTYGYQLPVTTSDDPLVSSMEKLTSRVAEGARSSQYLVNLFPFLKYVPEWMPGGSFQKFARESRETYRLAVQVPFEQVKSEMVGNFIALLDSIFQLSV